MIAIHIHLTTGFSHTHHTKQDLLKTLADVDAIASGLEGESADTKRYMQVGLLLRRQTMITTFFSQSILPYWCLPHIISIDHAKHTHTHDARRTCKRRGTSRSLSSTMS